MMIFGPRGISCDFFFPFFFPSFSPADRKPNSRHYDSHASPHRIHTTVTMASEEPTNRLYVGNIPWSTTIDELRGIFSGSGAITLVDIPTGRQGRSRGYGIVEYATPNEAAGAITTLDGAFFGCEEEKAGGASERFLCDASRRPPRSLPRRTSAPPYNRGNSFFFLAAIQISLK
jgi:hypothetical protein